MLWFVFIGAVVFVYVLIAPKILPKRSVRPGMSRGGVMDRIARWVVLGLGRLTYLALHLFEKLGVDMATVDETLAAWTTWSQDIKKQLKAALDDAQNLRDTDAAEDAVEANALSEALAAKVQAAYDAATAPPVTTPDAPAPGPVADPLPPVDQPTDPVPPVDPVTPTNPEDPSTPPADTPDVSGDAPASDVPVSDPVAPDAPATDVPAADTSGQ